jgi:hypothetical protein
MCGSGVAGTRKRSTTRGSRQRRAYSPGQCSAALSATTSPVRYRGKAAAVLRSGVVAFGFGIGQYGLHQTSRCFTRTSERRGEILTSILILPACDPKTEKCAGLRGEADEGNRIFASGWGSPRSTIEPHRRGGVAKLHQTHAAKANWRRETVKALRVQRREMMSRSDHFARPIRPGAARRANTTIIKMAMRTMEFRVKAPTPTTARR